MALRLICQLPSGPIKKALPDGSVLVGSDADCDVRLSHPTVSRRHAQLTVHGSSVTVEDLGSSNGTRVGGRRISGAVELGEERELSFGHVRALLQEVRDGDLQPAISLAETDGRSRAAETGELAAARGSKAASTSRTTLSSSALEGFVLQLLPELLDRLAEGAGSVDMAQAVGAALFRGFPCLRVEAWLQSESGRALLFTAGEEPLPEDSRWAEGEGGEVQLRVAFFPPALGQAYAPVVRSAGRLIELAGQRRRASTSRRPAPQRPAAPPLPAPPTVDPAMRDLYRQAARVAQGDVSVLIEGESGTGKEVLARYLHAASGRPAERLISLNCAALPRDLLEAELFGIESGVATGVDARAGKFELAHGGTLFLDEIGDMALETQAKILRVLQEREVYRLGGKQPRPAQVRVLAATNRDLDGMVATGAFRGDLYHRIAGWVVRLPPLRRRRGDLPNLAAHFLAAEAQRLEVGIVGMSQSALAALMAYGWPGNIRELQREIARAALFLGDGDLLESTHLDGRIAGRLRDGEEPLKTILERVEREEIERALRQHSGDAVAAANSLGIGRSTLYRRMKALGVQMTSVG